MELIEGSTVSLSEAQRGDAKNHTFTAQNPADRNTLRNNNDGTFTDVSTGTTHKGYVDESTGGRVFQQPDGTLVQEIPDPAGSGHSDWVLIDPAAGQQSRLESLGWDDDGNPTNLKIMEGSTTSLTPQEQDSLQKKAAEQALDVTTTAMIDGAVEGAAGPAPEKGFVRNVGSNLARGTASAGYGAVLGTAMDINDGMDPDKAIAINTASSAARWAAGAVTGAALGTSVPIVGTVVGFGVGLAASYLVEKSLKNGWDEST